MKKKPPQKQYTFNIKRTVIEHYQTTAANKEEALKNLNEEGICPHKIDWVKETVIKEKKE